jgi:hypothetical protein
MDFEHAKARAAELADHMKSLTEEQRMEIMRIFHERYCKSCGDDCGWRCQCENDE